MRNRSFIASLVVCAGLLGSTGATASSHREATPCTIDPFTFESFNGVRENGKQVWFASGRSMLQCGDGHPANATTSRFEIKGEMRQTEGSGVAVKTRVMHYPHNGCVGAESGDGFRYRGKGIGTSTPDGVTFTIDARRRDGSELHLDMFMDYTDEPAMDWESLSALSASISVTRRMYECYPKS